MNHKDHNLNFLTRQGNLMDPVIAISVFSLGIVLGYFLEDKANR